MRIEPLDGSGEAEADGLTKRDRLILAYPPAQNLTYGVEDSGAHPGLAVRQHRSLILGESRLKRPNLASPVALETPGIRA